MKLYTFAPAANALRVEMFLREKKLTLETISVNVRAVSYTHLTLPTNC